MYVIILLSFLNLITSITFFQIIHLNILVSSEFLNVDAKRCKKASGSLKSVSNIWGNCRYGTLFKSSTFHHISPHFTIFHHISPYFTIFHHISPYFILADVWQVRPLYTWLVPVGHCHWCLPCWKQEQIPTSAIARELRAWQWQLPQVIHTYSKSCLDLLDFIAEICGICWTFMHFHHFHIFLFHLGIRWN